MSLALTTRRRIVQILSLIALNMNLWAISSERFCLPVMNCEACAVAWLGCPIGMLGRSLVLPEFPWVVFVSLLAVGVFAGRFLCGWVCPMGFLQDLLHKIPSPKLHLHRFAAYGKYAVLALTVFAVPLWYALKPLPAGAGPAGASAEAVEVDPALLEPPHVHNPFFFCKLCPTAALEVVIPAMAQENGIHFDRERTIRFSILAVVLIGAVLSHRSFCKVLCPVGALIAVSNWFSLHRVRIKPDACVRCKKCNKKCPMDVPVMQSQYRRRAINRDTECIGCLTCEEVCPTRAIGNNSRVLRR